MTHTIQLFKQKFAPVLSIVVAIFVFVGCGEMEEAVKVETDSATDRQAVSNQVAYNEDDEILSNFIGPRDVIQKSEPRASQTDEQVAQIEKQMQDLQVENANLKQKLMKVEQENRNLTLRLSDTESKLALERERADRAESSSKANPAAGVTEAIATPARPTPKSTVTLSSYEEALRAFNNRKYEVALRSFQSLLDAGVSEDMRDNCIYWIGESQYALKRYSEAAESFKEVLTIRHSEKKADAQFMLAQCYDKLGQRQKAKEAYEQVVKNYPMSRHVKRAKDRWAKL